MLPIQFRRIVASGRYIPPIDGLRFIAIAVVVVYHLQGAILTRRVAAGANTTLDVAFSRLAAQGHFGVQLFFVISGLVLALPFALHAICDGRPVSLRSYFLRRLTRLEPPYLISMVGFAMLSILLLGVGAKAIAPHFLASIAYIHNVTYGTNSTINTVAWSLEVEIQFYCLMPFLARLFTIRSALWRRGAILGLAALSIACQASVGPSMRFTLSLTGQIQFFLVGLFLADLFVTNWAVRPTTSPAWDLVTLFGWPLLAVVLAAGAPHSIEWIAPPLVLAVYCAAFRGTWSRRMLSTPWLTAIGGMCYSIYLLHFQLIRLLDRFVTPISGGSFVVFAWHALLILPCVLLVSGAYFLLVERPCMNPSWPQQTHQRIRELVGLQRRKPPGASENLGTSALGVRHRRVGIDLE